MVKCFTAMLLAALCVACGGETEEHARSAAGAPASQAREADGQGTSDARPKIVVKKAFLTPEQLAELEAVAPNARIVFVENKKPRDTQLREIGDADALLTDWLTPEIVRAGPRLKWIQHYASGVDDVLSPELVDSDIVLTNCKIIQGPEIADHGFALLLALTRRLAQIIPTRTNEEWKLAHYRQTENWPEELGGKTALIIGVGGIGMQLAQRAHGFGMRVIGVDPKDIPLVNYLQEIHKPDALHELLPRADVVFMSAPLTERTRGMMGAAEFGMMPQGAYFIGLSRGETFDNDALAAALASGHLAGAGLDVTYPEPLPPGHPLWTLPNVVLTPHMAGQSDQVWKRRFALLKENLRRYVERRPLLNVVDKRAGY